MREKILQYLQEATGYVSGQELSDKLGVSRTAVWKNIKALQQEGYSIEAVKNRGYVLVDSPDAMDEKAIHSQLRTKWIGRELYVAESIDSTNDWAKRLAEEGVPDGTLAVADEQTGGKGRRGRSWVTPKGSTVAFTLLLRPEGLLPERASMLTLVMGLSVAQGISALYDLQAGIKWPNDVVVSGKKISWILTEMSTQIDYINYIVIGTGINANLREFPEELKEKATSLVLEMGQEVRRAQLIGEVLAAFERNYEHFLASQDLSGLLEEYNMLLLNRDREVRVLQPGNEYNGIARGINESGELLVEREDGSVTKVYAGEVSVRGLYGYV